MANQIKRVKLVNNVLLCLILVSLMGLEEQFPIPSLRTKCTHGAPGREREDDFQIEVVGALR